MHSVFEGTYIAVFVLNIRANQLLLWPPFPFSPKPSCLSVYVTQFDLQHYFSTYLMFSSNWKALNFKGGEQVAQWSRTWLLMKETWDVALIPGWGRSPRVGNGNPLQYSCLENSRREEPVPGVAKSCTQLGD